MGQAVPELLKFLLLQPTYRVVGQQENKAKGQTHQPHYRERDGQGLGQDEERAR